MERGGGGGGGGEDQVGSYVKVGVEVAEGGL